MDYSGYNICNMCYTCLVYDQSNMLNAQANQTGIPIPNYLVNHAPIPNLFYNNLYRKET